MIKPIGSDELQPRFVSDVAEREKMSAEAESLPSVIISSQAAGNAVMMAGGGQDHMRVRRAGDQAKDRRDLLLRLDRARTLSPSHDVTAKNLEFLATPLWLVRICAVSRVRYDMNYIRAIHSDIAGTLNSRVTMRSNSADTESVFTDDRSRMTLE